MFLHWGKEYSNIVSVFQLRLIKRLLRGGVKIDLIVGSHPHVLHKHWYVDDTLIATSLGNLLSVPFMLANLVRTYTFL